MYVSLFQVVAKALTVTQSPQSTKMYYLLWGKVYIGVGHCTKI